ncbi:DUF6188 family protein [Streptomyces griseoluteus]|uniref:DUF6188 family protein n=1 Tax=Streptomyces griseoluteus TaxID=29306 RepID=UPI0036F56EF2
MDNGINRVDGGWDIRSMRGSGIGELIIGGHLRLHTGSSRIEVHSPAALTTNHEVVPVHASARLDLDRLPQLLDQVVAEVHAADSGSLRVRFAHGWRLDVPVSSSPSLPTPSSPSSTATAAGRSPKPTCAPPCVTSSHLPFRPPEHWLLQLTHRPARPGVARGRLATGGGGR